jgi:hypothetical protein
MAKKQSTYSIDEVIRKNFKTECTINEVDMSETIENFMENYAIVSKRLRKEREARDERR